LRQGEIENKIFFGIVETQFGFQIYFEKAIITWNNKSMHEENIAENIIEN
jgi:hypothetical protein